MVVFRALQGIGGGVLLTVSQAILRETFPPEEQGTAMGIFGLGVVLAPAFGPTLGGWLTDQYSWPWIFYINVPIGIINLLLVSRFVEDPSYLIRRKGEIDWLGLGLMVMGLGALQLMLEEGEKNDWFQSGYILRLAAVAVAGLAFFVWRELKIKRPAVDLRILRNVSFSSATALGGVLGMALNGSLFLLPLFLQNLLGYTALKSGLAMMPRSLAMAVIMPIGGRFYNRLGPRLLVGAGLAVTGVSFWQLSHLTSQIGYWDIFWPQVMQGVGFSLIFVALSTAALSTIAKPEVTAATGLYNVSRQVFGSIGNRDRRDAAHVRHHAQSCDSGRAGGTGQRDRGCMAGARDRGDDGEIGRRHYNRARAGAQASRRDGDAAGGGVVVQQRLRSGFAAVSVRTTARVLPQARTRGRGRDDGRLVPRYAP